MMNTQAVNESRHPNVSDGEIAAWNAILHIWDLFDHAHTLEPCSIWPEWIRLKDGKHFKTPPNDAVYPQPK